MLKRRIGPHGVRNLSGCASAGRTEAEALENISEAIELYLETDEVELISLSGGPEGRV